MSTVRRQSIVRATDVVLERLWTRVQVFAVNRHVECDS